MGKNKKKKAQMFSDFLSFKPGQRNPKKVVIVNKPLLPGILLKAQKSSFQTPHGDQDKLTELLDDNSPNVGGPSQSTMVNMPSGSGTDIFSTSPLIEYRSKKRNRWKPVKPIIDSSLIQVNIKKGPPLPNLTVVEGPASKIQLVIDTSKKISESKSPQPVKEPGSSKPVDEPGSSKPMGVSGSSKPMGVSGSSKPVGVSGSSKPMGVSGSSKPMGVSGSSKPIQEPGSSKPMEETGSTTPPLDSMPGTSTPKPVEQQQTQQQPINAWQHSRQQTALPAFRYPAGIPRYSFVTTNNQESSSSAQANPLPEPTDLLMPTRVGPNWVLAPKANATTRTRTPPVWQPKKPISGQPNTGSGWPRVGIAPSVQSHVQISDLQTSDNEQLNAQIDVNAGLPQPYSPSDVYAEATYNEKEATDDELESPEMLSAGTKRLSAFQRLGPVADQPKKTKLTINLLCQKDVRNVVDETDDIPTHLRDYITTSVDETVVKYLDVWPFRKQITPNRTATVRVSKSVMMLETEYMEEAYTRDNRFILVVVTGYPQSWKKEDVLDAVLESVKGKSFIPCFIEFSRVQCRFLIIRSKLALLAIHKYGFIIRTRDVELIVSLSNIHLNLNQLDFVPRLILRKLLSNRLDGASLDLSEFTLKSDISHFVYFPLHRVSNQTELIQLQATVPWECLTSLNLSHNKITTLTGIDLLQTTPRLQHLNLGHNCIDKVTMLLQCRNLPLKTIHLEGNPLCNDYIDQGHYIKVLTMLFTGLVEIDGVSIKQWHDLPDAKRNYCPEEAKHFVEKVLETIFSLLDASQEQRFLLEELYHEDAVLTITFMYKLRYGSVYKDYRNLFTRARVMDEGDMESVVGPSAIAKVINRWPDMMHDPTTFNVDVLYHAEYTTIVRIGGIVKITAESLADEEHLLSFTRTLVLNTRDGSVYKIANELLYWDIPDKVYAETAFKITRVKPKNMSLRLDSPPDEDLKEKLVKVFMQITELKRKPSERCLEAKDWNIRNALEYFSKLLKLDNLDPILRDLS